MIGQNATVLAPALVVKTAFRPFSSMAGRDQARLRLKLAQCRSGLAKICQNRPGSNEYRANVSGTALEKPAGFSSQRRVKNDQTSQFGKTRSCARDLAVRDEGERSMTTQFWRITLVLRTIGARRGRAARGRPQQA
jgi:hypothetical protein